MRRYTDDELATILGSLHSRGVFRERDLLELGMRRSNVRTMVVRGGLKRLGRGLYSSRRCEETPLRGLAAVAVRIPRATVCLLSALRFHGLFDEEPAETWVAMRRGDWVPVVRDVPIRVVRFSGVAAALDVERHDVEGVQVPVYGAAKSVIDAFRFRHVVAEHVSVAALRRLLGREPSARLQVERLAVICRGAGSVRPHLAA